MLKSISTIKYLEDYQYLIYRLYSEEFPAYPCIYYRLDLTNSIYESTGMRAGSYEIIGDLSGYKWHKIHMLPVFLSESANEISNEFNERGTIIDLSSSFVLPYEFGLEPMYNDFVLFPNDLIRPGYESKYPLWIVTGNSTASISDITMTKVNIKTYSYTEEDIDKYVSDEFIFIDFFKKIYPIDIGRDILRYMIKSEELIENLYSKYIEPNNGLLYIKN